MRTRDDAGMTMKMAAGADVILPASYDLMFTAWVVVGVSLAAWAGFRWKSAPLTGTAAVLWFLVILLIPVLGPIAFLLRARTLQKTPIPNESRDTRD